MSKTTERRRRSVKLTNEERRAFKKWVEGFDTKIDAQEALGVSKPTLDMVLVKGSGHPDTIEKIKSKIQEAVNA